MLLLNRVHPPGEVAAELLPLQDAPGDLGRPVALNYFGKPAYPVEGVGGVMRT